MVQDRAERKAIDTHVHVWPLDDAPGHQPAADSKLSPPKAAAPVEWLLQDMRSTMSPTASWCRAARSAGTIPIWSSVWNGTPAGFRLSASWTRKVPPTLVTWSGGWPKGWPVSASIRSTTTASRAAPGGVDAPEHDDLWAAAAATGAILQFHMLPQHAPALARMIERHPQVRVIVDHIGKPDVTEAPPYPSFDPVLRLADYPHVYAKIGDYQIASQQAFPWADTWPFVRLLADRFGAARMLWGTGYPRSARLVLLAEALRYVERELPLTPDERRQILWETPARLFGFAATSKPAGSGAAAER